MEEVEECYKEKGIPLDSDIDGAHSIGKPHFDKENSIIVKFKSWKPQQGQ